MHHYAGVTPGRTDVARHDRLFSLMAQTLIQGHIQREADEYRVVSPAFARLLQTRALDSLRPYSDAASSLAATPRNPVATTNFSELSEREAGGFTLATLAKRCLRIF